MNQADLPPAGGHQRLASQPAPPEPSIEQQVIINTKLHGTGLHLHFQRVLPTAIERAVKKVSPQITERSVPIATKTTKELVLKDYAMERDEDRIRNAARVMVSCLAGNLANVSCKEPLRTALSRQLRYRLQGLNVGRESTLEDNLNIGCAIIEQAATRKAVEAIDVEIASAPGAVK